MDNREARKQQVIAWFRQAAVIALGISVEEAEAMTPDDGSPELAACIMVADLATAHTAAECARICDAQQCESECPERAKYCADEIRSKYGVKV